ncbi:unnamed protein product, partial [Effrenium voratum]
TEAIRMGGLELTEDASGLQVDGDLCPNVLAPDTFVRGLLVTFPDSGWLDNVIRSLPAPAAPGTTASAVPVASAPWQLLEIQALVGSHNTLRWLDEPLKGLSEAMAAHYPLDESGQTWRLKMEKLEDGQRYWFGGEVPLEFVCHPDCAVVVELVALVQAPSATTEATAPLLGAEAQQGVVRKQTLGWMLLLPFYHATSEELLKAAASSGERASLSFDVEFFAGPGLSLLGEEVWPTTAQTSLTTRPEDIGSRPVRPAVLASRLRGSFQLCGDRVVQWLRQHIPLPPPEIQQPMTQPSTSTLQPMLPRQPVPMPAQPVQPSMLQPLQPFTSTLPKAAVAVPTVRQELPDARFPGTAPVFPGAASLGPAAGLAATAPVVEKIYLRDQAVQSDPPPLGFEDNLIGEGAPQKSQAVGTAPASRPLGALDRAHLLAAAAPALASVPAVATSGPRIPSTAPPQPAPPSAPPGESVPKRRELRWKFEDEDLLQGDEITLEFLSFRSFSDLSGERVYFQLRFFLFPELRTAACALTAKAGEASLLRSSVTNERLAAVYSSDGYSVASTAKSAAFVHRRLVEFLSARTVEVELWSADSEMQIGVASVALESLVRQGHQVAKTEQDFAVLEPFTGEPNGTLRVLLVNRGQPPTSYKELTKPPPPPPEAPGSPPPSSSPTRKSRHKVSALATENRASGGLAEELNQQKHERLRQLRMLRQDADHGLSQHGAMLAAAESLRQDRKRQEVARRMDRFNTSQLAVTSAFASPSYFTVEFTNPYGQQATFYAHVLTRGEQKIPEIASHVPPQQPLQGVLPGPPEQNLMLIKDPEEWRRLASLELVPGAPSGDFGRLAAATFVLNPRETISLPFRHLDFNFPGLDQQVAPKGALRLADVAALLGPNAREYIVEVGLHQGPVLRRVEVSVVPQPSAVDRNIRFFEAEGAPVEKALSVPPAPESSGGGGCFVYCTNRSVHVQRSHQEEVTLRFLAPQSPGMFSFFVVFYADAHFSQLVAAQLIQVQGMRTERIRLVAGQSIERSICLAPAEVLDAGTVRLHSSNPEVVAVQQTAEVDPRYGVKFTVMMTSMQVGTKNCRLHAVDPAIRRLVAAMLIVIAADPPEIKMVHSITLPVLTAVRKRLLYKNEAVRPLKYAVRCSEPALVSVQSPELVINSLDTRCIELLFHAVPATLSYSAEVFLFITSDDRAISETRLLQLSYT